MSSKNIVVIGAGPSGVSTALKLSNQGYNVYLVDEKIGGNYCFSGSIVSNALLYQSYLYDNFREKVMSILDTKENKSFEVDFKKVKKNIESLRNKLIKTYKDDLLDSQITYIQGKAKFTGTNSIKVTNDNNEEEINFYKAVIATGSIDRKFDNVSCKKIYCSSNVLSMDSIPKSIIILGGGFVGCEYATFFKRLGTKVKIVEKGKRLLSDFDEQVTKKLEDYFKKDSVEVFLNKSVQNIERIGNKTILFLENDEKIEAEEVFLAIGRIPNLEALDLHLAGINVNENIPELDSELRTTNKDVYVVGDATGKDMLVNWAYLSSDIVASNILNKTIHKNYVLPKVAFLDPEIASVGYTEDDAIKIGFEPASIKYSYNNLEKSLVIGYSKGFAKVIYDRNLKRVLGAHIIGKGASELISMFAMIIQAEIKIDNISDFIFNHPTFAEVLTEIGSKVKSKKK